MKTKTGWIRYQGTDDRWRWKFINAQGHQLAQSSGGTETRQESEREIRELIELGGHLLGMQGIRDETDE